MSNDKLTPGFVKAILGWPVLWPAVRLALVSAYLVGGWMKLMDFHGAVLEQEHFGLNPGWLWAALSITIELGGSLLIIFYRATWLGAGSLGILTFIAMLLADNFWNMHGSARFMAFNTFFEHLGLIAGLVLITMVPQLARRSWSI